MEGKQPDEEKATLIAPGEGSAAATSRTLALPSLPANIDKRYLYCCGCCGGTCCCLLLVIMWLIPGLLGIVLHLMWCKFTSCWNLFDQAPCQACKDRFQKDFALTPVGINEMPFGYYALPFGLIPNFTTYNQFMVRDWDSVWRLGAAMPEATWNGTWWRGNELGFIVNNPYFWSGTGIFPASIALGVTAKQHSAIRPFLEEAFGSAAPFEDFTRSTFRNFFAERRKAGGLEVPHDLQVVIHQVLHHVAFGDLAPNMSWEEASDFVWTQTRMVKVGTASQFLPGSLYFLDGFGALRDEVGAVIDGYAALLAKSKWASKLKEADCQPSVNCTVQLASAIFDALYAAGGLSVPGGLSTGLGVMYSESDTNPAGGLTIPPGKELEFFWESIRFYAPVYGFPYWPTRPTCRGLTAEETKNLSAEACPMREQGHNQKGMHPVNQWQGGERMVLYLARAQRDPSRWGNNSHKFILRNLSDYSNNSVGFAEMAVDKSVNGGRNDRVCPGKDLALAIGRIFFEEFRRDEWKPDSPEAITLDHAGAISQVSDFMLKPV